jgi:hypothetical protein
MAESSREGVLMSQWDVGWIVGAAIALACEATGFWMGWYYGREKK